MNGLPSKAISAPVCAELTVLSSHSRRCPAALSFKKLEAEDIVFKGAAAVPPSAQKLISYLNQKSPKNTSDPSSLKE